MPIGFAPEYGPGVGSSPVGLSRSLFDGEDSYPSRHNDLSRGLLGRGKYFPFLEITSFSDSVR